MADLSDVESLTTQDLQARMSAHPPGTFVALPDLTAIGVVDVPRAFQNWQEGSDRAKAAYAQSFFIEVINLRVQHAEFWLRVLLVHGRGTGYIIPPDDRRTFGQVIEECVKALPASFLARLRAFNKVRIEAVHKYLLGATDYGALKQACDDSVGIDKEVYDLVLTTVGRPVTTAEGRIGEIVVQGRLTPVSTGLASLAG